MRGHRMPLGLFAASVAMLVVGYRAGDLGGLMVFGAGAALFLLPVRMVLGSIPTIRQVRDAPAEDGLDVPRDIRPFSPEIARDGHVAILFGDQIPPSS